MPKGNKRTNTINLHKKGGKTVNDSNHTNNKTIKEKRIVIVVETSPNYRTLSHNSRVSVGGKAKPKRK